MPPLYIKPENALKRSEELLALGTAQSREQAFENLIEVFQSKRFKLTPTSTLEPIVIKFLDLCVDLQRRSHARYALLAYRNAVQTTNSQSVENVLNHFIAQAESRLSAATEQAKKEVSALPENPTVDDELPLQPSDMLLDTFIDNTNDRERIERRLIAPAQKFCYDAYDTSLDVCKGNDRLELVYQSIAQRAFKFCVIHQRKTDFRRLCEQRLRKDLANAAKYGHQQHAINLSDPETLSRHLDIRFLQLETAVELELWQEAFRSVEDVHGLVAGKKGAKPSMMANYYEKLTQIFKAEGGKQTAVFHAAAWARYFQYAERAGSTPEKAPGCVLLSALAVPLGEVETKQRLIALLNLPKMPTRDALVKDAAAKHLRKVPAAIRQIYNALEVDFQPLKAAKMLAPVISSLPEEYQPYLPALREVVLSRLLSGLSEVYDTVSLSHVISLVQPFDETAWKTDMPSLEKFLMTSARRGEINATIDHVAKSLTFTTPSVDTDRLSNLAVCLYNTMQYLNPAPISRSDAFTAAIAQAEEERKQAQHRRQIVIKRRELLEEANIRRNKEESTAKAEKARQLAEETSRREKEYQRQAEKERIQKEIDATRREEAKKLAESLQAKGALKVDMKDIEDLDSNQVLALQVQQLDKEKREMTDRLRIVGKRVDHLERAMRKEERPLLAQDYERQKEEDKVTHEKTNKMAREQAVARQSAERELKERLGRMMPDYLEARKDVESQRAVEFERAREEAQRKVEAEKEKFRTKVLERRKREKERREKERQEDEERERAEAERAEAEARAAAEEEEREAAAKAEIEQRNAEAAAKAEERKKARDAERAEAAAAAEKQRQREEEAERRRAERSGGGASRAPIRPTPSTATTPSTTSAAPPTIVRPGGGAPGWRERAAAKAAGGGGGETGTSTPPAVSSPSTYTPPSARVNGTASPAPAPAPTAPARTESPAQNGEEKVTARGVYQPSRGGWRGRGGGTSGTPPPSTRGGAAGGARGW